MDPEYVKLLVKKAAKPLTTGLKRCPELSPVLFDFQRNVTELALLRGRFAQFLDTGLGKTLCQLEWCRHVHGDALILAPLAVADQTRRDAETKLGIEIHHSRDGKKKRGVKITIANYERLHLFDLSEFNAIALDESSILKSFMGKTKQALVDGFSRTEFRSCYTATPAPNDYMELGNHAEFLGIMSGSEMLSRWFINDTMHFGHYRLKGHAVRPFWEWVASWAACVEKPSDAGGDDAMFKLPPLETELHQVESDCSQGIQDGYLIRVPEMSATSMHREKRYSLENRVAKTLDLINATPDEHHVVWCQTNEESTLISKAIGDKCVEVTGSQPTDVKEHKLNVFGLGQVRDMVTKQSICGFGLNWQHCHHQIFPSLSYSYEEFYQAVRRSWRFGQKHAVKVDVVLADSEMPLWKTISSKRDSHDRMKEAMKYAKLEFARQSNVRLDYNPQHNGRLPKWLN